MSYVFVIHNANRTQFVIAADTRETLHGEVRHLAHTDFGEKLFFSSKHKFALACFDGSTVRNKILPNDDKFRLFVSYILGRYFKKLDADYELVDFKTAVEIFWRFINTEYIDYIDDIKKEVCFVFAGFDKDGKSQCVRYGAYFDNLEKVKDKGKIMDVGGYIVYGPMIGFIQEVIDKHYLEVVTNRSAAEALTRKQRVEYCIDHAFEQKQAIKLAQYVAQKAFDEKTEINQDDTVGDVFDFVEMRFSAVNSMIADVERHRCRTMDDFFTKAEESIEEQRRGSSISP